MTRRERLEALLDNNPSDVFANYALAMEWVKEERLEQAFHQFDRVLTLDPQYIPGYFQKGKALLVGGRLAEAREVLGQGIAAAKSTGDHHAAEEMQVVLDDLAD